MESLLQQLQQSYQAYIDEHTIKPDYLLLRRDLYSQLTLELAIVEKKYRPYIDEVTIVEMDSTNGWLYIKK